jgi:hypothetical protein
MPPERLEATHFSSDILDFIKLLYRHHVRYVVVGGEAVIYHGHARLTGDVDFFYDLSADNVEALYRVLEEFWAGDVPGIKRPEELLEDGVIVQFGRPPNRIDLLNRIDGVAFSEAWLDRVSAFIEEMEEATPVYYAGLGTLIRNKEAAGRPKDLEDLAYLQARDMPPG